MVDSVAVSEECFLGREHIGKASVVVQVASTRSGPHVHGAEDFNGCRFWALEIESESSDEESMVSLDTLEFIKQVKDVCLTIPQMMEEEKELDECPSVEQPKEGTMAKKIEDAMVRS